MGYPHITDLNLSHHHSFNNAKPNPSANLLAFSHATSNIASNEQPLGSSRWNPTPEQLLALEELYRRGTRTPSAAQIQQIATRLRRFGKIEGKNVFYWFQNHKARERQKRRRELDTEPPPPPLLPPQQQQQECDHGTTECLEKKELQGCDIEQTKLGPPSNFSKHSEEFNSRHGVIQEEELQQTKSSSSSSSAAMLGGASTWQPMELWCNSSLSVALNPHQNLLSPINRGNAIATLEDENREEQTLELFPLGGNDGNSINISKKVDNQVPIRAINTSSSSTPNQYIEFLPVKKN